MSAPPTTGNSWDNALSEREPRNGTEMDRSKLVSLTFFFSAAPHLQLDGSISISISMKVKGIATLKCVVGLFLPAPVHCSSLCALSSSVFVSISLYQEQPQVATGYGHISSHGNTRSKAGTVLHTVKKRFEPGGLLC